MKADEAMSTVVDSLINQMADGADTWTMPWNVMATMPRNAITGANYRGGNVMSLLCTQLARGYTSLEWATYKQWQSVGGQVNKGAKAAWIIVWKPIEKVGDDGEVRQRMMARAYAVFNRDVISGDVPAPPEQLTILSNEFFDAVPARIVEGAPAYAPSMDVVFMPKRIEFTSIDHYHGVLAHELAHWTGHSSRLDRDQSGGFGSPDYAREELVAELSSAFTLHLLHNEIGTPIMPAERLDHAAYLKHWIAQLKEKPSLLWTVASKAQAATDHLLSYSNHARHTTEETADAAA